MSARNFRFGVVSGGPQADQKWLDTVRRVEDLGFATLVVPDTLQRSPAPFVALAAAAAATRALRLGTYVVNTDYRHPVMLAKEAATLDNVSEGRFELGIGAGRPTAAADNAMLGLPFDAGAVRVERLMESLALVKRLFAEETVDTAGKYVTTTQAALFPVPVQKRIPILIAAGQRRLLTYAAGEADMIALAVQPGEGEAQVAERIGWIREAAGDRFSQITININLMAVGGRLPRQLEMGMGVEGARAFAESDALSVLKGTPERMCDRLEWMRERLAISYILVADQLMDALAPVVARLAGK